MGEATLRQELPIVPADETAERPPEHDHYRMLSVAYSVRSSDEGFREALGWHLEPFRRPGPDAHGISVTMQRDQDGSEGEDGRYALFLGHELRFRHRLLTEMLTRTIWELHGLVPKETKDMLLLHAGAVVRGGRAWLLAASRNSGKSSLVTELLARGLGYLSDELGAIDPITGRAYPFAKRISLEWPALRHLPRLRERLGERPPLTAQLPQTFLAPEELGASVSGPAPVGFLVFPLPVWDGPPRLTPLPRAEAVELMAADAFNLYRYGERGIVLLSRIAERAPAFRLEGGSPRARADLLLDQLS